MFALDAASCLAALAVALTAALVHFHLRVFSYWSSRGIGGPRPWPVFGTNIYYIFGDKLALDRQWREQYGHTYGLYEGYSPLLRTTDNKLLKSIYVKNFNSFTDRHSRFAHGPVQRNWLLWSKGARWSNQRALVSPMFSSAKMRLMFAPMSQCVDNYLQVIRERIAGGGSGGGSGGDDHTCETRKPADSQHEDEAGDTFSKRDISSLTLDVIATCFFSLKLNNLYARAPDEFLRRAYEISSVSVAWLLVWLLIPRQLAEFFQINLFRTSKFAYFEQLSRRILNERRHGGSGGGSGSEKRAPKGDIIQAFVEAKLPETYENVYSVEDDKEAHYNDQIGHREMERRQEEHTKQAKLFKQFTDTEITGQMVFLLFAGFETTAATLSFCLFELAHRPELQAQLFAELKEKFGAERVESGAFDAASAGASGASHSDLLDLKLLDAFVSETLRLHSPLVEHNRVVTEPNGFELPLDNGDDGGGGAKTLWLPRGMPISTNGYVLQRDPDYFEQPDQFDATRFLPENRHKLKACTFMPFGLGPRHCLGMRFALLEVKLALVKTIARYLVRPARASAAYPPTYAPNLIFLQLEHSEFTLTPRHAQAA